MKNGSAEYYEIWTNTGVWASLQKIALGFLPVWTKQVEDDEEIWGFEWRSHSEIMGIQRYEIPDSYETIESKEDIDAIDPNYYVISDLAADAAREKRL